MNLPSPIQVYFDAYNRNDDEALILTFAPDAIVEDEGHSYAGRDVIEAWSRETRAKYQPTVEPLEIDEESNFFKIRAKVTGQFTGSPVTLTYAFRLDGDKITRLEIGA